MFTIYMHIICTYELVYNLVPVENDQFYATSAMNIEGEFFSYGQYDLQDLFMRPI
jgi:hypothetical protein